ncbi:MAG: hypothetical protein A2Y23_14165 [Clostridiales bacterium GWB2_37_7]|nr:MAG: hypothetical protein A2Y23_14165 [Clostridiales bacterium GWB2_37_7]
MKCINIKELMSAYIDNEINEVDKAKFEKHIAQCPQCKEEYELLKDVVLECSEIDEVELPEDFREMLHNKLMEAKATKANRFTGFMRKNSWKAGAGAVAAVLILAIALNSLGLNKSTEYSLGAPEARGEFGAAYDMTANDSVRNKGTGMEGAPTPAAAPSMPSEGRAKMEVSFNESMTGSEGENQSQIFATSEVAPQQTRKIIKNGNVSLKVTDVQTRINEITALAEQGGGYVESSYVDNIVQPRMEAVQDAKIATETTTMIANMTIKVPAEKFEGSFQTIIGMGKLINQNSNSTDVTIQYRDLEARIANLKVQETHLQEIMTKATTVEDTLKVEVELNRVRTEIDIMTGSLKNWDQMVEYSTIYINMTEVKEAEIEKVDVPGVWQKAQEGFINAINNIQNGIEKLLVFLVSAVPYIVILGVGSLFAILWIRRKNK